VVISLRPSRGGFLRPFGCGIFIRDFLSGKAPFDSAAIDPRRGACQGDIFYYYKIALHRAYARDRTEREIEGLTRRNVWSAWVRERAERKKTSPRPRLKPNWLRRLSAGTSSR